MTSMRTALLLGATVALGACSQKFQQPRIDDMTAVQPNGGTTANTQRAEHIIQALIAHYVADPERLPVENQPRSDEPAARRVVDFVASMTDRYAIELYEELFVPQHWSV